MLGSQLVVRALARQGVTTVFSLSGNQIMPVYDACIDAGIRIVHVRHEAAAVFMADAWAQVTGGVGVALLTAGPGLANGVAPLMSALHAESPVLLLSGDAPLAEDGLGAFQALDQPGMTRPVTKAARRVGTLDELAGAVDGAIALALAPRRGPVHLALPFDLLTADSGLADLPPLPAAAPPPNADAATVGTLATLLAQARSPLVLAGPDAARAHRHAAWLARGERLAAPVLCLESPRGLRDPSLGAAAQCLAGADLLVLAGKPLDFTLGFGRTSVFGPQARVAVLDPDPALVERARHLLGERLALACVCEPGAALDAAADRAERTAPAPERSAWLRQVAAARATRVQAGHPTAADARIGSRALCEEVQRFLATAHEPIVVCDGGEFGQWAQAFCTAGVRIVNGVAGAIGGGLCQAIAAKIARPEATVVVLMGDGTAGFHLMELDTAVRASAPVIAVIGNDLRWNAEHQIQLRSYGPGRLVGCQLADSARYHAVAQALGGFGLAVREAGEIAGALRQALASGLPACIDVAIDGQPAPVFGALAGQATGH
ncbi:thiamine pyrophosphate-binding protein [Pseudorhodoferax sp. Leaf274]|uniref:thiamine pyrophosphate-binding protein n=1 Tax=Pseudorhodoferax sp. Leaf274 TaxID=1736318 RepID=UPI0007030750|nr:thiamine pyrophosphate-binding protein [Pseudorhodoferax sp. Leaf274]KQP45112.1 acetolactate synthase [Pseudorhodoferax sp. Leaf274]